MDEIGIAFLAGVLAGGFGMLCIIGFIGGIHVNVEVQSNQAEEGKS